MLGNFAFFFSCLPIFFFKINIFKYFFSDRNTRVSDSMDPDQARHFVGSDLGLNCLQRLSEDNKSRR